MNFSEIFSVIKVPHTSEKSTILADKHKQITFKVNTKCNKYDVKKAVEHCFDVKVKSVSIVNVKGKTKRFRQMNGKRSDWKKAYVSLLPGYDIDFSNTK